ncbi:MAG: hypothetical protein H7Z19_09545, partial [Chitinophagaceae bacterium]|nr:hypothetical protein [Rubrivivax sp.]
PTPDLAAPAPAPAPAPSPGTPQADDIIDASGNIKAAAYKALGAKYGSPEAMAYRYGSASGIPDSAVANNFYEPPSFKNWASACCNPNSNGSWSVGGPIEANPGPYFSNMANGLFVTEDLAKSPGVSTFQTTAAGHNTFAQKPQWSWIYMDGVFDESIRAYKNMGKDVSQPTALGRCSGRPGWCVVGIAGFQNGLLGATRTANTAIAKGNAQLPPGNVPTAISVTNGSEFALVSVWDTVNVRGRIAVVALTGMCNDCTLNSYTSGGSIEEFWGEWTKPYPGLTNLGNIGFMKVLGFVELPEMKAPTGISVTTGWNPWVNQVTPAERDLTPLSNESNRQTFVSGVNKDKFAKHGIATVISKSEQKVAFVDLKPLFAYYRKMYFGARGDFDKTTNIGSADSQWPFPFSAAPEQTPTVIKTMAMGARPTAVKSALWNANRSWIATEDGKLHIYDLGGYTAGGGNAGELVERGTVNVGKNPTGLAYYRTTVNSTGNDINAKLVVVSRGERKVQWVDFSGDNNSGSVVRELQDKNLKDPIAIEDNETNGSFVGVLTIASHDDKGIHQYRYTDLQLHSGYSACKPNGCPTKDAQGNRAPFEYGGKLSLPGKPFAVAGGNVP